MQGIRFYLDHETPADKRKGVHTGNVTAIIVDNWTPANSRFDCRIYEAIGALLFEPNSVVCGSSVGDWYLRNCAKRISEAKARQIHPELFKRLDN